MMMITATTTITEIIIILSIMILTTKIIASIIILIKIITRTRTAAPPTLGDPAILARTLDGETAILGSCVLSVGEDTVGEGGVFPSPVFLPSCPCSWLLCRTGVPVVEPVKPHPEGGEEGVSGFAEVWMEVLCPFVGLVTRLERNPWEKGLVPSGRLRNRL